MTSPAKIKTLQFKDEDYYRHLIDETNLRLVPWIEANTLSVCMVACNEEQYIAKALSSVHRFADEIIIGIDTRSTDRTREIALGYTDKVYDLVWTDNFSDARNFALEKASGTWVLQLDADEYIPSDTYQAIRNAMDMTDIDAYMCPVKNWQQSPESSGAEWVLSESIRLFKNDPEVRYSGYVHEGVFDSVKDLSKKRRTKMDRLNHFIWHFGYLKSAEAKKKKHDYYGLLLEKQLKETPTNFAAVLNYAINLYHDGKYDEAEKYYLKALELNPQSWAAYNDLGALYFKKSIDNEKMAQAQKYFQLAHANIKLDPMASSTRRSRIITNLTETSKIRGMFERDNAPSDTSQRSSYQPVGLQKQQLVSANPGNLEP